MSSRIRPTTLDDLETIIRHRRLMFADGGQGDPALVEAAEPTYREWLRERLANGLYQGWFMLAPDDSVVAGVGLWLIEWPTGALDLAKYRGYVFNVFTEREHRRQGHASRLMRALLEAAAAQGVHVVSLHASQDGRPVYEALGFTPVHEMRILLPR